MSLISVCIPTYNRPAELATLLESIAAQDCARFEVVISDDGSPRHPDVQSVVTHFHERHPCIRCTLHRNHRTIGYDANLRQLLRLAQGEYCLFMGDDDLLLPGAIQRVRTAVETHEDIGVVLRSYYSVDRATGAIVDIHRYFDGDRFFPKGEASLITFFRRSVFISGYTIHRATALSYDTDRFDGTLLYQLHLTANVLLDKNGFYISDFLTVHLPSFVWHFGVADSEKGRFAPGERRPEQCVNLIGGMLQIARSVQQTRGAAVYAGIRRDMDHYVYGPLSWQAHSRRGLLALVRGLWQLGLGRSVRFWASVFAFLLLGGSRTQMMARWLKAKLGTSRLMGAYYQGMKIPREHAAVRSGAEPPCAPIILEMVKRI